MNVIVAWPSSCFTTSSSFRFLGNGPRILQRHHPDSRTVKFNWCSTTMSLWIVARQESVSSAVYETSSSSKYPGVSTRSPAETDVDVNDTSSLGATTDDSAATGSIIITQSYHYLARKFLRR